MRNVDVITLLLMKARKRYIERQRSYDILLIKKNDILLIDLALIIIAYLKPNE